MRSQFLSCRADGLPGHACQPGDDVNIWCGRWLHSRVFESGRVVVVVVVVVVGRPRCWMSLFSLPTSLGDCVEASRCAMRL